MHSWSIISKKLNFFDVLECDYIEKDFEELFEWVGLDINEQWQRNNEEWKRKVRKRKRKYYKRIFFFEFIMTGSYF